MLELENIVKDYVAGENVVHALKGISFKLRDAEFVSILGPSGCGKTTTLNIVGGLDRYTEGDLKIDGVSTKKYTDKDWDIYRNHSVGFVFQSYNLIPHQTIISNVELALTIGNVPKDERRAMAMEALTKVGLEEEVNKFPNQLSGGQMQRVAIARAIVNKPKVILADEPTGALDTKTSIQVLDILKELSQECLILMVTHNTKLAEKYSSRIISIQDGLVISDTNPFTEEIYEKAHIENEGKKKAGMPFTTALKLSFSNMKSKIGRTLLTCFAGSIGIIGIALILSVSNGFNSYIEGIEQSTISNYPVSVGSSSVDITSMMTTFMSNTLTNISDTNDGPKDKATTKYVMVDLLKSFVNSASSNDLKSFKKYLDEHKSEIEKNIIQITYNYSVDLDVYAANFLDDEGKEMLWQLEPFNLPNKDKYDEKDLYLYLENYDSEFMESYMRNLEVWSEIFDNSEILNNQYNFVVEDGSMRWPEAYNEVVFVLKDDYNISDYALYATGATGVGGIDYVKQLFAYVNDPDNEADPREMAEFDRYDTFDYDTLMACEYYVIPESTYYQQKRIVSGGGLEIPIYSDVRNETDAEGNNASISTILGLNGEEINDDVIQLKVVGVVVEDPDSDAHSISGTIGYSPKLTEKIIDINNNSAVVKTQEANPNRCVIDNYYLSNSGGMEFDLLANMINSAVGSDTISDTWRLTAYSSFLSRFGYVDKEDPSSIYIYPKSFEDKDAVEEFINKYNQYVYDEEAKLAALENREIDTDAVSYKQISYNDYVGQIMGSVSTIINAITYVLIAFVSISLIVSSIMIAIITYISVLERTKEIGILRAMGASKRDVKNIFNAETFITGLISGVLGVVITIILDIPISLIIENLAGIENIAVLPWEGGLILIAISFVLSVISGLIPASYAAKCDPVIALRTD